MARHQLALELTNCIHIYWYKLPQPAKIYIDLVLKPNLQNPSNPAFNYRCKEASQLVTRSTRHTDSTVTSWPLCFQGRVTSWPFCLGGVWRVDCRYSSHEWACLLTYEQSIIAITLAEHFCYSYWCNLDATPFAHLLNSSGPKWLRRSLLTIDIIVKIFYHFLLLLLLWICFYSVALSVVVVSRLADLTHPCIGFQQPVHSHTFFSHLIEHVIK